MGTWELIADLPVAVESYSLEGLSRSVSSNFERQTTIIRLHGDGHTGTGEDVVYDNSDHDALQAQGPVHDLSGPRDLSDLCDLVEALDLFPVEPAKGEVSRLYRRWAFESAALDLALRQAGRPLHEVLGREPKPVTFVMSLRLGDPASMEPVRSRLANYPGLRFKLDPTSDWDDAIVEELRATGAVDSLDFKSFYTGTVVDNPTDVALYERLLPAFPDAWIEDPDVEDPEVDELLRPHRDRVTWDAPIHSVGDIRALPFPPKMVNVKPSRLGTLRELCAAYDYTAAEGIGAYGGGQFELGPGRGQAQYLASLFHPDTPNDLAPVGYNDPDPQPGLPPSPLEPRPAATGFYWED